MLFATELAVAKRIVTRLYVLELPKCLRPSLLRGVTEVEKTSKLRRAEATHTRQCGWCFVSLRRSFQLKYRSTSRHVFLPFACPAFVLLLTPQIERNMPLETGSEN